MPRIHVIGFLVLLSTLPPSEAIIKKLNSIQDLKTIAFGPSVPAHSLVLLHWFANIIEFNSGGIQLPFRLGSGDHGTHPYGNHEQLLPHGHRYYSLGNLKINQGDTSTLLSHYNAVSSRLHNQIGSEELNMGRIVFRVQNHNTIVQVYITQHDRQETTYDPVHTYEITANLLRELRDFSLDRPYRLSEIRDRFGRGIDDVRLNSLRDTWGELACLGLLVFILTGNINLRFAQQNRQFEALSRLQGSGYADFNYTPPTYQAYHHNREEPNNFLPAIIGAIIIIIGLGLIFIIGMSAKVV